MAAVEQLLEGEEVRGARRLASVGNGTVPSLAEIEDYNILAFTGLGLAIVLVATVAGVATAADSRDPQLYSRVVRRRGGRAHND